MKRTFLKAHLLPLLLLLCPSWLLAIDTRDTRMLTQPAISRDHVAFIYGEDLWVANPDGSLPRRLTVNAGIESNPMFSPDGKTIAFSGEYDGNIDVYTIPVEGGVPKRLTWHPGADIARGFSPDGKSVYFISQRTMFTRRLFQLFSVPAGGGREALHELPNAFYVSFSADGQNIAFTPYGDVFRQWKGYRGGTTTYIQLFSVKDKKVTKMPQASGGSNDTQPVWIDGVLYFRSDRDGEFNLYSFMPTSGQVKQLTHFTDFPVLNISGGNGKIILEQAGYLHLFDPGSGTTAKLPVGIAADLPGLRPRFVNGDPKYIRSADISPSGSRVVVDFRGDIITLPAEKGDARNLTNTTGVHETFPAWSPDGKSIAYYSDASGEYALHIQPQDGKGEVTKIKMGGSGFYDAPHWSPDGKKIQFSDNGRSLYVLDVASKSLQKIDSDDVYVPGPFRTLGSDWSADSKWLAYTRVTTTQFRRIYLYNVAERKSYALTDGLSDASEPHFDRDGKYLYFMASTDAGPVLNWFDQSNNDYRMNNSLYLVTLQNKTVSPLAKESDEEAAKKEDSAAAEANTAAKGKKAAKAEPKKEPEPAPGIDWEGIQNRIIDIPVSSGNYGNLGVTADGVLLYVEYSPDGNGTLHKFDLKSRKEAALFDLNYYQLSIDGKKMLYAKNGSWGIAAAGEKPDLEKSDVNISGISVKIDPVAEWAQIYDEAWRISRDYFYDPNMHGADWPAMKTKYAALLPHLTCRSDLNRVIGWLGSELRVGHDYITAPGDLLYEPRNIKGGLLGADYSIENNRYRFRKIYGGLNWNPKLRSPLTEPGVNAKAGEYLLALNGKELTAADDIYQYFENTAGKIVELTIGPNDDMKDARTVKVVPVDDEAELRNRDWVEGNLRKVTEATKGQVAYVYVPNTAGEGHDYFKRYFYPQADRKAIIIDERFNGGGQIADYYINLLVNPLQSYWHSRYGKDTKTPSASIQGPKVMIIDEHAGSGGDMLPWMFRKFKVGTLVGKRTWGGLVGILGYPDLLDGGAITAPNIGIWTKDGFIVENEGVAPDIEVEQSVNALMDGRDPQLEKAIEVALKELEKNPPVEEKRPPLPIKVKK